MSTRTLDLGTSEGPARIHIDRPEDGTAPGALVLGHGAGGGVQAPDLRAATSAALAHGWPVVRVEQPYRVAGRRAPPRAPRLDAAWIEVCAQLSGELEGLALVTGGRSSGARVACRTAAATGAIGVLCLAFPLQPPPRRGSARVAPSRLPELEQPEVPVLVVQGETDRFGMVPDGPGRTVVRVAGDHALRRDEAAVSAAVGDWLSGF